MTVTHQVAIVDDSHLAVWLRSAGIAAIAAAALGSVLLPAAAVPGTSTTGTSCTSEIGGNWTFRNCDGSIEVSAP
ncbi:MAG TPA: hypothetical protein VLK03_01835 [Nocardioides sp.]|nr:hypothetical protein [Nocardioides sp.]